MKSAPPGRLRKFLYENGLLLVVDLMILGTLVGQTITGWHENTNDLQEMQLPALTLGQYLESGHFLEATFENWESEFLQMAMYVVLTVFLFQKGSSESKPMGKEAPQDEDPRQATLKRTTPWPVRHGGVVLKVYEHSLSILLFALFLGSFFLHAAGGVDEYNQDQQSHGQPSITFLQYLGTSRFWFESFQNWQSEFMAVGAIVLLSIWLREKGSPESKPVARPHHATGND